MQRGKPTPTNRDRIAPMNRQSMAVSRFSLALMGALLLAALYLSSLYSYLLFHSIAELFSVVVACGIFIVAWNSRRFLDNKYLVFIGVAYLFVASIDTVHALAYKGMGVFAGYDTNLATQLWIAARYLESFSLLLAPLFIRRKPKLGLVFGAYSLVTALLLASIFSRIFPVCFIEGSGLTPFKKASEYVISAILVGAGLLLFRNRKHFDPAVFRMLEASIGVTIAEEMSFTLYVDPYGFFVLISFEETEKELTANSSSFGFNLQELVSSGKIAIDHMSVTPGEFVEAGRYDLDGLLVRIEHAVTSVGARRILLDGVPALFYGFSDASAVRDVLVRLYGWLKDKGLTAVVTAESETDMIRHGLGRSLPDCIVQLTERISNNFATRYLRVEKYRGSYHGAGEFPFLIGENGISLIPVTSIQPAYGVSSERITTGVPQLDKMLGGQGYYRGNSILVSGEAGTGKTSLAAHLAHASCQRGESCLYFAFEESENEILRNMCSIGIDFQPWLKEGLLGFRSSRATMYGLEMHLVTMNREINAFQPRVVILDPVTNLLSAASFNEVQIMVSRMIDFLKGKGITALFTTLTGSEFQESPGEVGVSSLMDTWIVLRNLEMNGERTRLLNIWKSRGMAHDSKVREFLLTDHGVELVDVYAGPSGILTGTARIAQQEKNDVERVRRKHDLERQERLCKQRRAALEAQIAALRAEIEATDIEMEQTHREAEQYEMNMAEMSLSEARQPGRRRERQKKKS